METRNVAVVQSGLIDALADIRRAFDRSFGEPVSVNQESGDLVLAIRAGAEHHVVRLSEMAGIHECRKIVPLPGAKRSCLGLIGLRGRFHGVFRLSTLLGAPPVQTRTPWLLVAPGRDAPAFAVEAIDGCLEINAGELHPIGNGANTSQYVRGLFVRDGVARGLLDLPSLVAMATNHAQASRDGLGSE